MHDVEANNHLMRSGGWLPPRSAFKSFNAQLALIIPLMLWSFASIHILHMLIILVGLFHGHFPSYRQVKTIALCSAIFERKDKNNGYFRQLWLVSANILPA